MANEKLIEAALEFSEWLGRFWRNRIPHDASEDKRNARHKVFLDNWRYYRTKMERIVNQELRERAIRLVMEGKPEKEIAAAIEKSNETRKEYIWKMSRKYAKRTDAEKERAARRREERKKNKKRYRAWKDV